MVPFQGKTAALAAAMLLATGAIGPVGAQSPEDAFKGKVVKIAVPTSPGGERSLYTQLLSEFYGRYIPGNPSVVADFRPGAGGAVAVNYLYNAAPRDGLVIGTPLAPVVLAQITGDKSVKYDVTKFNWIGRTADANRLLAVWHTSAARTLADMRDKEIVVGATGRSSETYMNPMLMNRLLGTKFKIVTGYKGTGSILLAMESGEIDGAFSTWGNFSGNKAAWLRDKKVHFLLQIALAKLPELPEVPLMAELADNADDRAVVEFMASSSQVGQAITAPPGVPAELVAALRTAFDATMRDPEFLATARKRNLGINPLTGAEMTALVQKTVSAPQKVIDRYKEAVGAK